MAQMPAKKPKRERKMSRGAQLLKEWRDGQKPPLSQPAAATRFDLHPQQISRYENGDGQPSLQHALEMEQKSEGFIYARSWSEPPLVRHEPRRKAG